MMEFSRNDLLEAIKKIDENPALRNKRSSSTYDLVFDENTYPPILVLSVANQLKGGQELFLADFDDKVEIPFKILADHGFTVVKKPAVKDNKDEFRFWLTQNTTPKSGSVGSYVKSIEWLSEKFYNSKRIKSKSIFEIEDLDFLRELYHEVKKIQIDKSSFIYNHDAPSYGDRYYYSASLNKYIEFLQVNTSETNREKQIIGEIPFNTKDFSSDCNECGLKYLDDLVIRFCASLLTKPFVILTGLSGSGKTKIAQSFAQWISESKDQYKIVPVGADWTNREPLLGYPNGLEANEYITPDSGVIHLFLEALKEENKDKPYFLILDEMNLSHVERYFADFLSIMESDDTIKLYTGTKRKSLDSLPIPLEISWPTNLFIIGTVNIDETTYMFSPKVLDRANVIEFRVTPDDIGTFLSNPTKPDLELLEAKGGAMAADFLRLAGDKTSANTEIVKEDLLSFFNQLKKVGAEFGYRSASEMIILINQLKRLNPPISDNECLDIAVMQKLLPKLHGSRSKLAPVLKALAALCVKGISTEDFEKTFDDLNKNDFAGISVKYEISFEKIVRMYRNVLANGFTSYAEA